MKSKMKHFSKSSLSILLALIMLVSTVAVGIVTSNAAFKDLVGTGDTGHTVYMCPHSLDWDNYSSFKLWVKDDGGGSGTTDYAVSLTKYSKTIGGYDIYYCTINEKYGGWSTFQFQADNGAATYDAKSSGWMGSSTVDGKVYNGFSNNSHHWDDPSWDHAVYYAGSTNSWNTTANPMSTTDYNVYSIDVTLEANSEFKFVDDGAWYGHLNQNTSISTSSWGSELTNSSGQNIIAPAAGTYTLYYRVSDHKAYAVLSSGGGGEGEDKDLTSTIGAYFHYLKDGDNRANVSDHLPLYKTKANSNIYRSKSTAYITGVSNYFAGWLSGDSTSTDNAYALSSYTVEGTGLTGIEYNQSYYNKPGVHVSVSGTSVKCYVEYNASNQSIKFVDVATVVTYDPFYLGGRFVTASKKHTGSYEGDWETQSKAIKFNEASGEYTLDTVTTPAQISSISSFTTVSLTMRLPRQIPAAGTLRGTRAKITR